MTNSTIEFCFQYHVGQLYMICKHCELESNKDEGVEVVRNEPITDENGLVGQLTEKRLYLSRWNFHRTIRQIKSKKMFLVIFLVDCRSGFVRWFQIYFTSRKKPVISIHTRKPVNFPFFGTKFRRKFSIRTSWTFVFLFSRFNLRIHSKFGEKSNLLVACFLFVFVFCVKFNEKSNVRSSCFFPIKEDGSKTFTDPIVWTNVVLRLAKSSSMNSKRTSTRGNVIVRRRKFFVSTSFGTIFRQKKRKKTLVFGISSFILGFVKIYRNCRSCRFSACAFLFPRKEFFLFGNSPHWKF